MSAPGFSPSYASPNPTAEGRHRFDAEIWGPARCAAEMVFLELACGTGAFLDYLAGKGVAQFLGIDDDPALAGVVPERMRDFFLCEDIGAAVDNMAEASFDRVIALNLLEHFGANEAQRLLAKLRRALKPDGRLVIKVPNAASPWGLSYQHGDLTHRTAFTPTSLRQLADASGWRVLSVYPQRRGSRLRLITDALLHRFLSWALLNPPQFWSANLYAILAPRDGLHR